LSLLPKSLSLSEGPAFVYYGSPLKEQKVLPAYFARSAHSRAKTARERDPNSRARLTAVRMTKFFNDCANLRDTFKIGLHLPAFSLPLARKW
jgi:hypothetical protein